MRSFDPREYPIPIIHRVLLSGVAPRPIALVASTDSTGRVNLSPFSFFNAFGANPPVVVVSPAFRGKDGTPKHTFENITETREFTVNAVSYGMVEQVSLASSDYERGVDEFVKAGFTKRTSTIVGPPGVAESPFTMECRLMQYLDTGSKPGSGNLLVAEVVMLHVRDEMFEGDTIDPRRLDLVGRMGNNWYVRASGEALFELSKPRGNGIGIDMLPRHIRESRILTGNNLARLASVSEIPDPDSILASWAEQLRASAPGVLSGEILTLVNEFLHGTRSPQMVADELFLHARAFLDVSDVAAAWECAMMADPAILSTFKLQH